jgi:3-hydroxyisobutyrate dehydrogenase-like beta-hydroxyacid dehydrogenase
VTLRESHHEAVREAELVVSAVTASQTVAAASACARALPAASFFLDLNSASPGTRLAAAAVVTGGGGRFVEGALMAPVPPYRLQVPLLLGGPDASALAPVLEGLGFAARVASDRLGVASATKMCRSVMIKGLEATLIESLTTARHYGVEDAVLASLKETFPSIDWETQAAYFFQRVVEHGARRSEEMREAAVTVQEAGLSPWSSAGTAERQAWVAALAQQGVFGPRTGSGFARCKDFRTEADRILRHLQGATRR